MQALTGIQKTLGNQLILQSVDLSLIEGGINCLLGPSGCGKSTLLRITAGLLPADAGTIHIDPAQCAIVFQEPRLLPWLTVKENLALALPSHIPSHQRSERITQTLHQVKLGNNTPSQNIQNLMPRELSGGMAQRVGIARALLRQPRILLMDEPFAALDAITRADLQHMLMQLIKQQHTTCLFVTHDINEATTIGDQISIMRQGRIVQTISTIHKNQALPELKQQIIEQLHH